MPRANHPDNHHNSFEDFNLSLAIRVVIVEDRDEIREGLRQLLDAAPGFHCVGAYGTMEESLTGIAGLMSVAEEAPQVVLIDQKLPGMSGIEGIEILKKDYPQLPLVVLTVFEEDQRIIEALCAGASGYLLKKTQPEKLLESLREVVNGGAPMSPEVARRVVEIFRRFGPGRPPVQGDSGLTPHEHRVLKLLVNGHNYKTAAAELGISVHTVSFHVRHIYGKLQVHSKSEAIVKAIRNNIV